MARVNRISRAAAESLAVKALEYLAGEPEHLGRFLALSGLGPDTIRAAAGDPRFLAGILEYITEDERLFLAFADHAAVAPADVMRARAALSGEPREPDVP